MITLEDYMEKMQAFKEQGEKRKEFYSKQRKQCLAKQYREANREKIAEQRKQYCDAGTKTQTEVEQPKTVAPAKKERTEKKSYKETMKEIDYNIRYGEKLQLPKDFYDMWA